MSHGITFIAIGNGSIKIISGTAMKINPPDRTTKLFWRKPEKEPLTKESFHQTEQNNRMQYAEVCIQKYKLSVSTSTVCLYKYISHKSDFSFLEIFQLMITDNGDDFSCVQAIEDNIDGSLSKPSCSRQMTAALDISCISAEKVARSPKTQKSNSVFL